MNLKEAFRYQNKLQALLDEAQGILDCDSNVTNVANTYLRHKVMAEAEDETILDLPQTEYAQQITDIARFMLYLLEEYRGQGMGKKLFKMALSCLDINCIRDRKLCVTYGNEAALRLYESFAAPSSCFPAAAPATVSMRRATRSPTAVM